MDLKDLYDRLDARIARTEDKLGARIDRLEDKYDRAIASMYTEVKPVVQGATSVKFLVAVVAGVSTVVGAMWGAVKYLAAG